MTTRRLGALAPLALLLTAAPALADDGHITFLTEFGTGDRPMVLAASDRGIALIGPGGQLFRTFRHDQVARDGTEQPFLWVDDIDNDRADEIVGAGSPSFVIEANGDPVWGMRDCTQFFLGDFIDSSNQEVFCRRASEMEVRSNDGQEYFRWSGRGYTIGDCYADDYDGDGQLEVNCALGGDSLLSFDLEFAEPEEVDQPVAPATQRGVDRSRSQAAASGTALRVGARSITLGYAGGSILVSADGAQIAAVPVSSPAIYSAAAADLDRDGTPEIYVGGVDAVYVLGADGALLHTVAANPDTTRRDARVSIRSATANGLENSDRDAIRAVVDGSMDRLTSCYSNRMGADQFTRVGEMLWELTVGSSGSVSDTNKRHSSLRNSELDSCVGGVLEDLRFSPATDGSGIVNVTLEFDFVDVN